MKAEKYINRESFVIGNPDCPIIKQEDALKAVEMAREEMEEKAIEAFKYCIDSLGLDDDNIANYIEIFKDRLEEKI